MKNVYVADISMAYASDGARIKVWPNTPSASSVDLQGGGGTGAVDNITYDGMTIDQVDYAIEITQCYGQKNLTLCLENPSPLSITNIVIKNFTGTTSDKYDPDIAAFICSSEEVCNKIVVSDIDVLSPSGTDQAYCINMDESTLDVTCTDTLLGTN